MNLGHPVVTDSHDDDVLSLDETHVIQRHYKSLPLHEWEIFEQKFNVHATQDMGAYELQRLHTIGVLTCE